ncbi:phosphatase PAP2 family protein [Candidatus Dependentiae bacterium]|nr:phosphatase PAP2 family protein [Candidatus Dependentiae bacterium]
MLIFFILFNLRADFNQEIKFYFQDILAFNKNIFSIQSLEAILPFVPIYLVTRMQDEKIANKFYCDVHHKNICNFPQWLDLACDYSVLVPVSIIVYDAFYAQDIDLKRTSLMTIYSFPFLWAYKNLLKKILFFNCALRPRNEFFCNSKRFCGGFPSGHMIEISFMATLFGIRFGPNWAIPLTVYGIFIFSEFIASNRHYLSQLIAGIGLGFVFALSANKVIDNRLSENFCVDVSMNSLKIAYNF